MFKKILFQIHWFVGITAGTLLMLVGVTGATLSFSDEIIEALNPGVIHVARQATPLLDVPQLITQIQTAHPDRSILAVAVTNDPSGSPEVHAVRVNFAAPPGQKRNELRYADPYNGQLLPPLRVEPFFKWVEFLHRFLLLPTPTGKVIMGSTALCLMFLALSGLYMRWPRRALEWRVWFKLNFRLKGRAFLWHLHQMAGTWALLIYLISSSTGVYWAFDWVKHGVDSLVASETTVAKTGNAKKPAADADKSAAKPKPAGREPLQPDQLARIWNGFTTTVPSYRSVLLRMPERASDPVQFSYLDIDAPHDQARNRLRINPMTGIVSEQSRYKDKGAGERLVSAVYVLHMGSYFGLPGRILMLLGALCLPLFGITGWILYLGRRRQKRAARHASV